MDDRQKIIDMETRMVRELGDMIGYGRMMQLAEEIWATKPHGDLGAHTVGPCRAFMVPCPHTERDKNGHCNWCCGSGRVTERVRDAMLLAAAKE